MTGHRRILLRIAAALLGAGLWLPAAWALAEQPARPLTVFAAASTRDALQELAGAWVAQGGTMPRLVFAGSGALARQIEQGAPADLFISADLDWIEYLRQKRMLRDGSVRALAGNSLVLVAPRASSPAELRLAPGFDLAGRLEGSRLALADVRSVPAGRYAKAALDWLGAWEGVRTHLAMTENVRVALALVARGEAPLGVVYASDALAEPRVSIIGRFPPPAHPKIVYPLAIVDSSRHPQVARIHGFLVGDAAAAILRRHGFVAPVDPEAGK